MSTSQVQNHWSLALRSLVMVAATTSGRDSCAQALPSNHAAARPAVEAAISRLQTIDPQIEIVRSADRAIPRRLKGRLRAPEPGDPIAIARQFLMENIDLLGVASVADELRLDSRRTRIRSEGPRRSSVTFQQQLAGFDVLGCSIRVHVDSDGGVGVVHGRIEPGLAARVENLTPTVRLEQLAAIVQGDAGLAMSPHYDDTPVQAIAVVNGVPVLVWHALVETPNGLTRYLVDARTGFVLKIARVEAHEKAYTGYGYDPFGNKRALHTSRETILGAPTGDYKLWFDFHESTVHGYDITDDINIGVFEDHCQDSNNKWTSASQEAETAAWFNIHQVLEYFYSVHDGWDSFDGNGGKINLGLHASFKDDAGNTYDANASGEGAGGTATLKFGDGTDKEGLPYTCLDVVAHEFTHALMHSLGIDSDTDQSAALHEAVADVFGLFVEKRFGNAHGKSNFRMGEEIYLDWEADEIRDIANPPRDHYFDFDPGGSEHSNSTILSHAAYLIWKGGNHGSSGFYVNGIGHKTSRDLWFNALVDYVNESDPSFLDMRYALEDAAEELGGNVETAVERAFNAIGMTPSSCNLAAALKGFSMFVHDKGTTEAWVPFYSIGSTPAVGIIDAELEDGSDVDDVLVILPPPSASQSVYADMRVRINGVFASFEPHFEGTIGFTKKADSSASAKVNVTVTPYDWGTAKPSEAISKSYTILNNASLGTFDIDLSTIASHEQAVIRLEVVDTSAGCGAVAFPELQLTWR